VVLQVARPTGLYGWVKGNDALSLKLFAGFALAIQLMAAGLLMIPLAIIDDAHSPLLGPLGYLARYVPIVLLGCVVVFAVQMLWYTRTVRKASGYAFVDAGDEPRLCAIIEPLIVATGMAPPFVGVIETPACNAFACGISRKHVVVVVTRGLLDLLTDAELEAVLATSWRTFATATSA
jgi:Zn-dependent protease with chaperone function